jgi:hypothetical protein
MLMSVSPMTSFAADGPVMPPLSQYGSLVSPPLHLEKLNPTARKAVETAVTDAAQGSKKANQAESIVRAAKDATQRGREAARKAQAASALTISLDGKSCRYSGEVSDHHAAGVGVMTCDTRKLEGQFRNDKPDGLIAEETPDIGFMGEYKSGRRDGLGADYQVRQSDAYEGEYKDGERIGFGIERDRDGFYPGRYGFYVNPHDRKRVDMELSGLQNFKGTHWAGTYGAYSGPKIACTLIKGAVLEGSVLDGAGAKFDAGGKVTEQGLYAAGILKDGGGPPC